MQITFADARLLFQILRREPARHPEPLGSCAGCRFSVNGRERGYRSPCVSCRRPEMSEFKPATKRHGFQAIQVTNGREDILATYLVTKRRSADAAYAAAEALCQDARDLEHRPAAYVKEINEPR